MPFKGGKQPYIQPTNTTLTDILGKEKLPYSQVLKRLWAFWKQNKLNTVEAVPHSAKLPIDELKKRSEWKASE